MYILIYILFLIFISYNKYTRDRDTSVCQWHKYSKKCWIWKYSKSKNKQKYECVRNFL